MIEKIILKLATSLCDPLFKAVTKKEDVKFFLEKFGLSKTPNDFPIRYTESIVELRKLKKDETILDFFRDKNIMEVFHDYYYADESKELRYNDDKWHDYLKKHIEYLNVGDGIIALNISIDNEIAEFQKIFEQKIHESRSVKGGNSTDN